MPQTHAYYSGLELSDPGPNGQRLSTGLVLCSPSSGVIKHNDNAAKENGQVGPPRLVHELGAAGNGTLSPVQLGQEQGAQPRHVSLQFPESPNCCSLKLNARLGPAHQCSGKETEIAPSIPVQRP
jgi:hypothetical protein